MAYIEITDAMVESARGSVANYTEYELNDSAIRTMLRLVFAAAQIRTDPEQVTHVRLVTTDSFGDQESIRLRIGDPPTDIPGPPLHVTKVQVLAP